jgi:hypothetical protein
LRRSSEQGANMKRRRCFFDFGHFSFNGCQATANCVK